MNIHLFYVIVELVKTEKELPSKLSPNVRGRLTRNYKHHIRDKIQIIAFKDFNYHCITIHKPIESYYDIYQIHTAIHSPL